MTTKEMIETLRYKAKNIKAHIEPEFFNDVADELEKQIAKEINYVKKNYGLPYECPICEAEQIKIEFMSADGSEPKEKHSYCWKCGQKLDWEVE